MVQGFWAILPTNHPPLWGVSIPRYRAAAVSLPLRPDRLPLLVGPVEHRLRAGAAATRLQHLAAVDEGRPVAHQIGREIGKLDMLASAAQRDRLDQRLGAAALLGHQAAPGAL